MPIRPLYYVSDRIRLRHSIARPLFAIGSRLSPIVYLSPFPRYDGSKFDWKQFPPDDDVKRRIRLRHSTEDHRLPIPSPLTPSVHLALLPRYSGRKIVPLREIGQSRKTTECPFDPYMTSQTKSEGTGRNDDRGFLFARR